MSASWKRAVHLGRNLAANAVSSAQLIEQSAQLTKRRVHMASLSQNSTHPLPKKTTSKPGETREPELTSWTAGGWRARSRAAALMYSAGAFLVVLSLVFSPDTNINRPAIWAITALAAAGAIAILVMGRRYTVDMSHAFTLVGSVLIAGLIVMASGSFLSIAYGMLFVWVAQFGAVFYRFRGAMSQMCWAACLHAIALSVLPGENRWTIWLLTTGTCAVVVVCYRLIERTSARLRGVMEHSGGIVLVIDPDLRIKYAGGAIERLLASTSLEITGRSLLPLVHPDDWTTVQGAVTEVTSADSELIAFDVRLLRADGQSLYTEANVENALNNTSLDGIVITLRDVTERKILEKQLLHQAFHDPLTGLPNRALFTDRLEWMLSRRKKEQCSLLFIDLDNFKKVNDDYGHETGDVLLTTVAQRLQEILRTEDTAARLGGDEFAILLDGVWQVEEALAVGERALEAARAPFYIGGNEIMVGASIGIAIASGSNTMGDLLREADVAMYMAKREGKQRCHVFHEDTHAPELPALARSGMKPDLLAS
jgi:diguanylate cyclase (GGDEF)-like protein/PAS domain S-box-containing protein